MAPAETGSRSPRPPVQALAGAGWQLFIDFRDPNRVKIGQQIAEVEDEKSATAVRRESARHDMHLHAHVAALPLREGPDQAGAA
jgi:hypothetical protein